MGHTYTAPTIEYQELAGPNESPVEWFDERGQFNARRFIICDWADRLTLAEQLLTANLVSTSATGTFYVGDGYPWFPGVYVKAVPDIRPFRGKAIQQSGFTHWTAYAILEVLYGAHPFNPTGGNSSGEGSASDFQLYEEEISTAAEFLTLPNDQIQWNTNEPVDNMSAPGRLLPMMEWVISFRRAEQADSSSNDPSDLDGIPNAMMDLIGHVNESTVVSKTLGKTFPAETLLYMGPSARRQVFASDSVRIWDITLRFTYKVLGTWNLFFRSGEAEPQPIKLKADDSTYKPYPLGPFTELEV